MIDITKDEFWENSYEEVSKTEKKANKVKGFVIRHKVITAFLVASSLLIIANTILIYNFFRVLASI